MARARCRASRSGVTNSSRVVDYEKLADTVRGIVASGHVRLVETLAERIAEACLAGQARPPGARAGGKARYLRRCDIGRRGDRTPATRFVHALTAAAATPEGSANVLIPLQIFGTRLRENQWVSFCLNFWQSLSKPSDFSAFTRMRASTAHKLIHSIGGSSGSELRDPWPNAGNHARLSYAMSDPPVRPVPYRRRGHRGRAGHHAVQPGRLSHARCARATRSMSARRAA